ncbi:MAG: DUF4340 domain-containing protein [Gemmataceae bacterium]|nr:DUF4340 domain-containing protein [Gemmataceae bacterium]
MHLKTTLFLVLLIAAGGGAYWYTNRSPAPAAQTSTTLKFLEEELQLANLNRVSLAKGKETRYTLERNGPEWSLPGKWPVRTQDVDQLVTILTTLRSRFTPVPVTEDTNLKDYGLDAGALTVTVKLGNKEHTLKLGEQPDKDNRFTRATFLRLDDQPEIVRLGPGIIAELDRPQELLQQCRLFQPERVARDDAGTEKVEQVQAEEIRVQGPDGKFTVVKKGSEWTIADPVQDRVDPDKLKSVLTGLPDFWADRFVKAKDKKLEEMGLDKPEYTLTVTRPGGATVRLLIGKISDTKERVIMRPGPPNQFGMPQKPIPQFIKEEYRYAKLEHNDQIFEIKTDKLKDVAVKHDDLRDPQVARFKTDDVRRVEIQQPKETLVLVKDKDKWKFEKPVALEAESQPITELLDKLSGLRATDKDIRDGADPKTVGLDKPRLVVKLGLEEGKGDDKDKKHRDLVYQFGTTEKEKGKLFVRVEGWPRVNALADDVLKLVERPVLAYRHRKVLDVASGDLNKIEIARASEEYTLEKKDGTWRLTKPADAKADAGKAGDLAADLARLETVEFVADAPQGEDLDKLYGLAKPAVRVKIHFSDAKKPAQTLALGKQRDGKDEWFARLDSGSVFVVKKDVRELLDRESLVYRPLELWELAADDVQEVRVQKEGKSFALKRKDKGWTISGPFDATAVPSAVEPLTEEAARPRGEKFVAHVAKELEKFGLQKPYLTVEVIARAEKKDKEGAKEPKKHILRVGKVVEKDAKEDKEEKKAATKDKDEKKVEKNRYAQVEGDPAVFVIGEKAVSALAKDAFDLLDKELVSVGVSTIHKVQAKGSSSFTLEQKKDEWRVAGAPAPEFTAEEDAVQSFLRPWARLKAERIAAYGAKIDWKEFGLDNPSLSLTVTGIAKSDKEKEKEKKAVAHTLALGKDTGKGERFARLDQQQAVAVLDAATVAELTRSHLDFVNHRVLKYDLDTVAGISRQMKGGDLELVKRGDQWRFAKPDRQADDITVGDVLEKTFRLRAQRIAAYPAKDLKPFGLDQPAAVVTLKLTDATGKPSQHVIKVGDVAKGPAKTSEGGKTAGVSEGRYALIDKGEAVVVLTPELSKHLVAPPLHFADRNVASFGTADKVTVERGPRKVVFTKPDTTWQMISPVKAEAEDAALDDFLKDLRRLRADEIVADKGDLKQFGLDRPQVQWTIAAGAKDVLTLLVGNPEPGKVKDARRYAKLGTSDTIFLLNAKESARALDEYRSRKPWLSLDAVQVEQLSYGGPAPFTLKKNENLWTVAGKPEAKVNAKAISDTLDALADLKVERWLMDDKGDLQLHGLQPPQLTIDVQTASGKRSLLIGRTEGASQRVYAAVAGATAIFIVSEEDAKRIVRPLSAFLEK